jgi:hypothetical protein
MTISEKENKPFSIDESMQAVTVMPEFVEVYIFSTSLANYYQQYGARKFFERLTASKPTSLDKYIMHQPIFLNKQAALQYARCIDDKHLILQACVPEAFIIGQPHALALRKNSLKKEHLQDVFLGWMKNAQSFKNALTTV